MRLKDYLELKELKVGLVCSECEEYKEKVKEWKEECELDKDVVSIIDEINKELKKSYTGKFKFDFCLAEDINIDELKVKNQKIRDNLKLKWFQLNDELSRVKTKVERRLKEYLDD